MGKCLLLKVHLQVIDCLHKGLQDLSQVDLRRKLDTVNRLLLLVSYRLCKVKYLNENLHQASMHLHLHEDSL